MVENSEIIVPDETPRRGRKRRTSPMTTESRRQSLLDRGLGQLEGGSALPSAPTTAAELVASWKIPPHEVDEVAGVLMKQQIGTQIRDIIARIAVRDFDLGTIAQNYGPGVYYFKGVPGPYETRIVTLRVSDVFARAYGYGKIPEAPSASDHLAVRTLREVSTTSGVEDDRLIAAIERAAEKTTRAVLDSMGIRPGTAANPDPMAQLNNMETMLVFMDRLEDRAQRMAERRLGIQPKEEQSEGIMGTVNTIGALLLEMMKGRNTVHAAQPMPYNPPPVGTSAPSPQPAANPAEQIAAKLTEDEKQMLFLAVAGLRPFLGALLSLANRPGMTDEQRAAELSGYIPDACAAPMIALIGMKDRLGLDVLSLIGPQFATPQWGAILDNLKGILHEKYVTEGTDHD
jgi:hypothetical protein